MIFLMKSSFLMQIFVKTLDGRSRVFDVEPNTKVKMLKEMIADKEGIPVPQQRLIFTGK